MKKEVLLIAALMILLTFTACRAHVPEEIHTGPVLTDTDTTADEEEDCEEEENLPDMPLFMGFTGTITEIEPFYDWAEDAEVLVEDTVLVSLTDEITSTNFIVGPETVLVMDGELEIGAEVTGFYDTSLPAPMIYPPQFSAVALTDRDHGVMIDRFDEELVSYDGSLQINLGEDTVITLQDGTEFYDPSTETLANRAMVVVYHISTRSIPAQTTPEKIIVLYERAIPLNNNLTGEEKAWKT